jgi:ferrous iron transport protein B
LPGLALDKNELDMIEHSIVEMETEQAWTESPALAEMRYLFIEKSLRAHPLCAAGESPEHNRSGSK